jgi:hypothetical protein
MNQVQETMTGFVGSTEKGDITSINMKSLTKR